MITKEVFNELKRNYYFLSNLPEKLQNVISDSILPDESIINIYEVSVIPI